jgi:hypothetical protein
VALLTQNPRDGIDHVGFAATVGPDDAGRAGAAKGDYGAVGKRFKANDFHFSELKQDVPFLSSTVSRLRPMLTASRLPQTNLALPNPRLHRSRPQASLQRRPWAKHAQRDDALFLEGRVFRATSRPVCGRLDKRVAGSQSEAQPPGAWMAVRGKRLPRGFPSVKGYAMGSARLEGTTTGQPRETARSARIPGGQHTLRVRGYPRCNQSGVSCAATGKFVL